MHIPFSTEYILILEDNEDRIAGFAKAVAQLGNAYELRAATNRDLPSAETGIGIAVEFVTCDGCIPTWQRLASYRFGYRPILCLVCRSAPGQLPGGAMVNG